MTLVEYGDFECPYCGQAEPVIRELLAGFGDLRYVWRHLPLNDVHPQAQIAAEASEAAGDQDRFWDMYDMLLAHQDELRRARPRRATPRSYSSTSISSASTFASARAPGGSPRTSSRPT